MNPLFKRRLFTFSQDIITLVDKLDHYQASQNILGKQLLRSGTSIAANIIEAQAGSSKKDFLKFFYYALKSANETTFWIKLLINSKKIEPSNGNKLLKEASEIANILGASILTLKGKKHL